MLQVLDNFIQSQLVCGAHCTEERCEVNVARQEAAEAKRDKRKTLQG